MLRTSIAIRGKDGVVFGVEKLVTSKLHECQSNKRIFTADHHIGLVCTCTPCAYTPSLLDHHIGLVCKRPLAPPLCTHTSLLYRQSLA